VVGTTCECFFWRRFGRREGGVPGSAVGFVLAAVLCRREKWHLRVVVYVLCSTRNRFAIGLVAMWAPRAAEKRGPRGGWVCRRQAYNGVATGLCVVSFVVFFFVCFRRWRGLPPAQQGGGYFFSVGAEGAAHVW